MPRTCLIFTCQLSAPDLQLIKNVLSTIKAIQKQDRIEIGHLEKCQYNQLECIANDLQVIIIQTRTNDFKFNAYLLKMVICKIQYFLSTIHLSTTTQALITYNAMSKHLSSLYILFANLTEAFS
jgi:hypothetical protein